MNIILNNISIEEWLEIENNFNVNPLTSHKWLKSFENNNLRVKYFKFMYNNHPIAIISGLEVGPRFFLLNRLYKILSFFSGFSFSPGYEHLLNDFIHELLIYAQNNGYTRVDFYHYDSQLSQDIKHEKINIKKKVEYIINLTGSEEEILRRVRSETKRIAKKATREGLKFAENNSTKAAEILIHLLESTKDVRKDKKYKDYSYFYLPFLTKRVICNMLKNQSGRIFEATNGSEILCSIFISVYNKRAYAFFIGTSHAGYKIGAPIFTWINLLLLLKEEGVNYLNIGGLPADPSSSKLAFFKESIGGESFTCWSGNTDFLQGNLSRFLTKGYHLVANMDKFKYLRKALKNKFT